ncbi:cell wall protein DAN4-like [Penaeus monodon]|uniref:cell wall protein DAN4-like n=1 Tax=Penaeus monodon TaxID=6687 RepID=UPI0018A73619|nr:cell wall protein DAN4-like [Penaeus monodon]
MDSTTSPSPIDPLLMIPLWNSDKPTQLQPTEDNHHVHIYSSTNSPSYPTSSMDQPLNLTQPFPALLQLSSSSSFEPTCFYFSKLLYGFTTFPFPIYHFSNDSSSGLHTPYSSLDAPFLLLFQLLLDPPLLSQLSKILWIQLPHLAPATGTLPSSVYSTLPQTLPPTPITLLWIPISSRTDTTTSQALHIILLSFQLLLDTTFYYPQSLSMITPCPPFPIDQLLQLIPVGFNYSSYSSTSEETPRLQSTHSSTDSHLTPPLESPLNSRPPTLPLINHPPLWNQVPLQVWTQPLLQLFHIILWFTTPPTNYLTSTTTTEESSSPTDSSSSTGSETSSTYTNTFFSSSTSDETTTSPIYSSSSTDSPTYSSSSMESTTSSSTDTTPSSSFSTSSLDSTTSPTDITSTTTTEDSSSSTYSSSSVGLETSSTYTSSSSGYSSSSSSLEPTISSTFPSSSMDSTTSPFQSTTSPTDSSVDSTTSPGSSTTEETTTSSIYFSSSTDSPSYPTSSMESTTSSNADTTTSSSFSHPPWSRPLLRLTSPQLPPLRTPPRLLTRALP